MIVFVRTGVKEMLEHLAGFCKLYAYSHGIKSYIMEVLKGLDPHEIYFKDRDVTVLAPRDAAEQRQFSEKGKGIRDYVD